MNTLDHEYLDKLKQTHPALRLLNADNNSLIISFFYRVFIQPNRRSILYSELHAKLNDYLYHLRDLHGEDKYPRSAKNYIDEWSNDNNEYLRQYYSAHHDEPELDLTPAAEKVIEWLLSLERKQFIGAESRLLSLFQLLRNITHEAEQDPELRIAELERQKNRLDIEITQIRAGIVSEHDGRKIKEQFLLAEETARKLLGDFREVEHNFRMLDREARERIAVSNEQKGDLLDIIFREQDSIQTSDQGKSFKAFWEFLMSPSSQDELKTLLTMTADLHEVATLGPVSILNQIDLALFTAGEKVYRTSVSLTEQLRKYLETQAYLENRRIMEIVKNIEKQAIAIRSIIPKEKTFSVLNSFNPSLEFIMSRNLFSPPQNPVITVDKLTTGNMNMALDVLYQQTFIDENELLNNIQYALRDRTQISLTELIELFPIKKGIEEIITYLHIASKDLRATISNDIQTWCVLATKKIQLPQIIFVR